jgi:C4-dicarboxylate transporter DctQ subunit
MIQKYRPQTVLGRAVNEFEEVAIAVILGVMTLLTFVNVVMRYGFGSGVIWGLEATLLLFAWLVLFGMSYAVKVTAHLGVDAVIGLFPRRGQRIMALVAAALCLLYAVLLMKGAWDYWAPFAGLEKTGGRWFPTGFVSTRDQGWYETEFIPMPDWLRFVEPRFNAGEAYSKLPRFIPYFILPFGVALLLFRLIEATLDIIRGKRSSLIVSHEAEEAIADVQHMNYEE